MRIAVMAMLVVLVAGLLWWQGSRQPESVPPESDPPEAGVDAPAVTPVTPVSGHEAAPAGPGVAESPPIEEPVDFDSRVDAMTRRDSDGLKAELLPDGSTKIDLQGRYQQAPVARLNEDGDVEVSEQ